MKLNQKRLTKLIFPLLSIFLFSACEKQENTIKLRVIWVKNENAQAISKRDQKKWLEHVRKYYLDSATVNIEFENMGQISSQDFFYEEFNALPKHPPLGEVSFEKTNHIIDTKTILTNFKKMGLNDVKKFLGDSSSINYDNLAKNVEKRYREEIHLWQSRIDRDNSAINSGTKWLLILKNMKKYDVIITNQLIINDSYDPFSAVSILHGAIAKGFAGQNRVLVSTAILDRTNSSRDDGQFIPYLLIHELGHALFNLPHPDEYSASVMSPDKYLKVPVFTEKERNIIRANLIMRDGEKFLNQRDYTRAIEKFKDALNQDPSCYFCAYLLARVHYELRDYGSSVSYLELTTRLKPTWSLPYEKLGDIYGGIYKFGAKGVSNAIVNYKKAVELEPSNAALHLKLAKCYEETGKTKDAQKVYLEVIKIEPTNSTALQALENLRNYKIQK